MKITLSPIAAQSSAKASRVEVSALSPAGPAMKAKAGVTGGRLAATSASGPRKPRQSGSTPSSPMRSPASAMSSTARPIRPTWSSEGATGRMPVRGIAP